MSFDGLYVVGSGSGRAAVELGKSAPETEAVFSLSSDEGGGEGRGEEFGFIGFPLAPLVPRGARECQRKVHSSLNSGSHGVSGIHLKSKAVWNKTGRWS